MLLRSSSTPILKSRVSSSTEASPAEKRARSVCFSTASFRFPVTGAVVSPEKRRPISRCSSSPIESLLLGGGGSESNGQGSDSERTDAYYQKMIEANPGNGLLLGNYARFLKDVQRDLDRAEEYCERAILANPSDGNVLSLYADLIWQNQNDSSRAENYFNQAVKTAPDDCAVMTTALLRRAASIFRASQPSILFLNRLYAAATTETKEEPEDVPDLPVEPEQPVEAGVPRLRDQPQELWTDGPRLAHQDQERDRPVADLPEVVPGGDLRVVHNEHQRLQRARVPHQDRIGVELHSHAAPAHVRDQGPDRGPTLSVQTKNRPTLSVRFDKPTDNPQFGFGSLFHRTDLVGSVLVSSVQKPNREHPCLGHFSCF